MSRTQSQATRQAFRHERPEPARSQPRPREGDMLNLPFDQYGRMRIVQNIDARARSDTPSRSCTTPRSSPCRCSTLAATRRVEALPLWSRLQCQCWTWCPTTARSPTTGRALGLSFHLSRQLRRRDCPRHPGTHPQQPQSALLSELMRVARSRWC